MYQMATELSTTGSPFSMSEDAFMRTLNITDDMYDFLLSVESPEGEVEANVPCMYVFHAIGQHYRLIHGYIALIVCLFGTVANTLNLFILTQKEMRTPINLLLTALAFVDVLVMLEYIPFALYMYIFRQSQSRQLTYPWAVFVLCHSHFTQVLHTMSIQLTLTMAIWRCIAICFTNQYQVNAYFTFRRCYAAIVASLLCPLLLSIPNYLTFTIVYRRSFHFKPSRFAYLYTSFFKYREARDRATLSSFCRMLLRHDAAACTDAICEKEDYVVDLSDLAKAHGGLLHVLHFWTFSVIVKLLPCVVLTFFMAYLVHTLCAAKRRQRHLQNNSGVPLTALQKGSRGNAKSRRVSNPLLPRPGNQILSVPTHVVFDEASQSCHEEGRRENETRPTGAEKTGSGRLGLSRGNGLKTRGFLGWRKGSSPLDEHGRKCARRSDRTSRLLVAVLLLFLLTEFPQGIMAFLSGVYGAEFFRKCYNTFAEIWDILALINSAVNFILYCFMSRQFRVQFRKFFPPSRCFRQQKWSQTTPANHKNTINTTVL